MLIRDFFKILNNSFCKILHNLHSNINIEILYNRIGDVFCDFYSPMSNKHIYKTKFFIYFYLLVSEYAKKKVSF